TTTRSQNHCSGGEHALEEKRHTLSFEVETPPRRPDAHNRNPVLERLQQPSKKRDRTPPLRIWSPRSKRGNQPINQSSVVGLRKN
ncbi:hypothetical protein A2U01_0068706, partial [Trifolium medium]|nr:hypothetical protein [Trifolium medium]